MLRRGIISVGQRALLGVYAVGWLGPRVLARTLARRKLVAFMLLCVIVWLIYHPATRTPLPAGCPGSATPAQQPGLCYDPTRRAVAANPDGQILHPPSVGVRAIWQALQAAGSPLADTTTLRDGRTYAEYIWDAGRASGVDPAVFMGMFNVESRYGSSGVARYTHSPGNMRAKDGEASVEGYASYPDWFAGIDATYALLREYALNGAPTVDAAIPVWAPASDHNDLAAYIAAVKETMARIATPNG